MIGKRYNQEKRQGERTDLTLGQSGTKLDTAQKIAKQNNISDRSVKRYAKDAELWGYAKNALNTLETAFED